MRATLYIGLALVYLLHNDWWLWGSDARVLGLPVGLTYHVGYCGLVVVVMALLVRFAWPSGVASSPAEDGETSL